MRRAFPWVTVALGLLAGGAMVAPALAAVLIYERTPILGGQVWRAWTGHVVHFGLSHFFWDLAVFLPAGCWLERYWPSRARCFYAVSPAAISAALLLFEPTLSRYAGISGVATGVLVLLSGLQLRRGGAEPAWFWWAVLGLVGVKIGWELFTKAPLLVGDLSGAHTVPLAHIAGAICGAGFVCGGRKGEGSGEQRVSGEQ